MAGCPRARARPSAALLESLRRGKDQLRRERERMTLREKVGMVLDLQRVCLPLLARQRRLAPWERPWSTEP